MTDFDLAFPGPPIPLDWEKNPGSPWWLFGPYACGRHVLSADGHLFALAAFWKPAAVYGDQVAPAGLWWTMAGLRQETLAIATESPTDQEWGEAKTTAYDEAFASLCEIEADDGALEEMLEVERELAAPVRLGNPANEVAQQEFLDDLRRSAAERNAAEEDGEDEDDELA